MANLCAGRALYVGMRPSTCSALEDYNARCCRQGAVANAVAAVAGDSAEMRVARARPDRHHRHRALSGADMAHHGRRGLGRGRARRERAHAAGDPRLDTVVRGGARHRRRLGIPDAGGHGAGGELLRRRYRARGGAHPLPQGAPRNRVAARPRRRRGRQDGRRRGPDLSHRGAIPVVRRNRRRDLLPCHRFSARARIFRACRHALSPTGRGEAATENASRDRLRGRHVHRRLRIDPDRQSRYAAVRHGVHGAHAQANIGERRDYGSALTATRTVPSASAITRSVLASNSTPTRRRLVTAASTRTPSPPLRKFAIAASMLLRALAASGTRSTTACSASDFSRYGTAARAAAPSSPKAASDSTSSVTSFRRSICRSRSSTGRPQTWIVASAPSPNQLFFSLALTRSDISRRSPDAATFTFCTVAAKALLLSSGNVFPFSCTSSKRFTSVNGMSIGTAILTRPRSICGTSSSCAGNGQSGLVSLGTMRVSACTPMVTVSAVSLIQGWPAKARVGRNSSHRLGMPDAAVPREIERHILAHSRLAAISRKGSSRTRACSAATCSLTLRSTSGLISFETLSLAPRTESDASPSATWATRLGSIRQAGSSAGREVTVTLPRMSARWSNVFSVRFCRPCPRPPSRLPIAPVRLPAWLASWPVARNVPFSAVEITSASGLPVTASGPRPMVQPISALESN